MSFKIMSLDHSFQQFKMCEVIKDKNGALKKLYSHTAISYINIEYINRQT